MAVRQLPWTGRAGLPGSYRKRAKPKASTAVRLTDPY